MEQHRITCRELPSNPDRQKPSTGCLTSLAVAEVIAHVNSVDDSPSISATYSAGRRSAQQLAVWCEAPGWAVCATQE